MEKEGRRGGGGGGKIVESGGVLYLIINPGNGDGLSEITYNILIA